MRTPPNWPMGNDSWRDHIADAWGVPHQRLKDTSVIKNPGMELGMMERALRPGDDQLQAMFWMYTTHIHLPDVDTLVRPALTRMFCVVQDIYRHAPNLLYGDLIFPAATWGEWYSGTYIQSERRIYICDGANNPPPNCRPDMDMAIDKGKALCRKLGLDPDQVLPYQKKIDCGNGLKVYDAEEVFRDIVAASKGSDADLSGMLEVEERDGIGLYDQLRALRGVQWPAPTYEIARKGGTPRRYLGQEGWAGKPYGAFRRPDGKAKMKLCEQDYSRIKEVCGQLMQYGNRNRPGEGPWLIDELAKAKAEGRPSLLEQARNMGLTPDLPDLDVYEDHSKGLKDHSQEDKYPFWLGLGIVYEHFHTAKTIRGATTQKLVPEQYVEMNPKDAERFG